MNSQSQPVAILTVDDHPPNLIALEAILEAPDRKIVRAASGRQALERAREEDFAVILLDVQMPEMDGFETARQLREIPRARETPILFVTAIHRTPEYGARGYATGAVDYIHKPVDPAVLRAKVDALVEVAKRNRRSEELLRACHSAILQAALDAVVTIDAEDCIVAWNPAAERIFGYSAEQAVGKKLGDVLVPAAYQEAHRAGLRRYLATGEGSLIGQRRELAALHAEGREIPVELTVTPIPTGGQPLFTGYLRDLTEQRRAEAQAATQFAVTAILAESPSLDEAVPRLLRAVCESTGWDWAAFWVADANAGALSLVSSFQCGILREDQGHCLEGKQEWQRGEGFAGRVWERGEPEWLSDISAATSVDLAAALEAGFASAVSIPVREGRDVLGVMELFSGARRDPDADALCLLESLGSQIGQFIRRKRAEENLARREERLRHLLSVTDAALSHLGLDDLFTMLLERVSAALATDSAAILLLDNDTLAVRAVLGIGSEAAQELRVPLGASFAGLVAASRQPQMSVSLARLPADAQLWRQAGIRSLLGIPLLLRGDAIGVLQVGSCQSRRFTDDDKELLQLVGDRVALAVDRARLIAALEDESARKSDFLSLMAHELRTPLSAINNALYILENIEIADHRAARQVLTAHRQTRQLSRLVDDLMDIGRISKGKIEVRKEPLAFGLVVQEAADAVRPFADARGQEFHCELTQEILLVVGDADRLEQVLVNLLQNAIKYTEPGGHVWLALERENGYAVFRVRDTGIGIDPPMLPQIFDLFHQAEEDEARARGGMGIGLALAKRLVELHSGTIEARSEGRGRGAEFTVRLPLIQNPEI